MAAFKVFEARTKNDVACSTLFIKQNWIINIGNPLINANKLYIYRSLNPSIC